ncbi:tetratricopeptide repeat protein [Siphonobacter sp. SORGH_AS_1065]|uniref:tetratricopeptide repeat protein n=1 Tax=Siphonobacter sp. SORGH_AS_1065 TaxID=3041795 RepID=UPI0027885488|nr:tetratricopeptide repeat protein [Siphonobacter sp. SORGH_AS_1065]MDQ1087032.1 tetratricopeptide (TPR) repeat protein [Siphonobacter sp. SORGH_AS_1065]
MVKKLFRLFFCGALLISFGSNAQIMPAQVETPEVQLGKEYLRNGEYEKARATLEKLAKEKSLLAEVYEPYLESLVKLKDWNQAEKFLKKQMKEEPENPFYSLDYARMLESQGKVKEADKWYNEALVKGQRKEEWTYRLGKNLADKDQLDWALKLFQEARKAQRDPSRYSLQIARLHRLLGQSEAMIEEYLVFGSNESNTDLVQGILQDEMKDEKIVLALEKTLYRKVQELPNEKYYGEMLIWYLLQQKEFGKAFIQARALDRRLKQEGQKVTEIGFLAMQNKDYEAAGKVFEYLVKEYPKSTNYPVYRRLLINAKEEVVKTTYPVKQEDIRVLINEYGRLLAELGENPRTLEALRNSAHLYAFYLDEKDTAATILQKAIQAGGMDQDFVNKCKLELGDVFLLKGEPWESTLLYSQVEKSAKDSPMGYDAKLKNAKLSYYKGDFELAKDVLDILKKATTREISNDAIELSLLIQDNTGMDTTETAMKAYAAVDLLLFQNRTDEALASLNDLYQKYKDHSLADEILWRRANTLIKENRTDEAIEDLDKIIKTHPQDILGDDALFLMAKLQQENKNDKETAMKLYQEILTKYPGSIYTAEARKRFRNLRGDAIN